MQGEGGRGGAWGKVRVNREGRLERSGVEESGGGSERAPGSIRLTSKVLRIQDTKGEAHQARISGMHCRGHRLNSRRMATCKERGWMVLVADKWYGEDGGC